MLLRRFLLAFLLLFGFAGAAHATLPCPPLPYVFVNGTVANALEVNANFSAVTTCLGSIGTQVGTNAELVATPTASYPNGVWRAGVFQIYDAAPLFFRPQTGTCVANGWANDIGNCNNTTTGDGNSWLAVNNGMLEVEQFGMIGDGGWAPGVTFASGGNAIAGANFPASAIGQSVVCYGCGTNGALLSSTVVDATHIAGTFGKTISSYPAAQGFLFSANTNPTAINAGDHFTLSDSRFTCSVPPVFNVDWTSDRDASLSVFTAGSCSVIAANPVAFTSSGAGAPISLTVRWGGHFFLASNFISVGGSGYTNGDVLSPAGLTCSVTPTMQATVSAGVVTALTVLNPGECTVVLGKPDGLFCSDALTGGTGTGAQACVGFVNSGRIAWGTDNVATAGKVAAAAVALGGATISLKPGATYGLNLSNPSLAGIQVIFNFAAAATPVSGLTIEGNGATFMEARNFNSQYTTDLFLFDGRTSPITDIEVNNVTSYELNSGHGAIGEYLFAGVGSLSNVVATNISSYNGGGMFIISSPPTVGSGRVNRVTVSGRAYNTEYGYNAQNQVDLVSVDLWCFECGRALFPYGTGSQNLHAVIQNPATSPTVLIPAGYGTTVGVMQTNLDLRVLPTVGGDNTGNIVNLDAGHGGGGGIFRNINLNILYDGRGDANAKVLLDCNKDGLANAASTWENIHITIDAFNIQNNGAPPNLIACPDPTDPSWSNETFRNFVFDRVTVSGDASATLASDLGGFTTAHPMVRRDVDVVGPWTLSNETATNRVNSNISVNGSRAGNPGETITANANATPPTATVTFTSASPTVITGIGSSSGYSTTQTTPVSFTNSGGSLPTGISAGSTTPSPVTYWVDPATVTANTVEISDTAAHALAGTNHINTSSTGTGTQTANNTAGMINTTTVDTGAINLSIGKWNCGTNQSVAPDTTTTVTSLLTSLNTADATVGAGPSRVTTQISFAAGKAQIYPTGSEVFTLDTPRIVYGALNPTFATSWLNAKNLQLQCVRLQ